MSAPPPGSFTDGKEMRYNERQFVDNALQESILSAAVGTEGKPGKGDDQAFRKEFEIPPGTIFAVAHQIKLVQLARKGETRDASIVFDGSDGEKSMEVISFFGGPNKADKVEAAKALSNMTSWPVSISYFPRKDGKSEETLNIRSRCGCSRTSPAISCSIMASSCSTPIWRSSVCSNRPSAITTTRR